MTCCEHRAICHRYNAATQRNDGPCLVRGCGCGDDRESSE